MSDFIVAKSFVVKIKGGKIQVEVEGESEERRRARLEREQRTQERTVCKEFS